MPNYVIIILIVVSGVTLFCLDFHYSRLTKKSGRYRVGEFANSRFIYYEDFEANWISKWKGNKGIDGYKLRERSGCYVILIFNRWVRHGNYSNYRDVYVGQSSYMYSRVHDHLNGAGNGDVYADVKYGKKVYVMFIPCKRSEMNHIEKELIEKYDATSSYNTTKGGSRDWKE